MMRGDFRKAGDALTERCADALARTWTSLHGRGSASSRSLARAQAVVDRCVSTPPGGWHSLVSDDHAPVELSVAFTNRDAEVRLLFEARGEAATTSAQIAAARRLERWLEVEHGARFDLLRRVEDLFLRDDHQGGFGMWHGATFASDGTPRFKIYLDTFARGRARAAELVRTALERLGNPRAWDAVAALADRGPSLDVLRFLSLDLTEPERARVKVYVGKHRATVQELVRAGSLAQAQDASQLSRFFECAAGGDEGVLSAGLPVFPCLDFVGSDPRPRHLTVHFPVRAYAANDAEARERVSAVFDATGHDTARFHALVDGYATRELSAGSGMLAYVSHRAQRTGPCVTVYLSTEACAVGAPHEPITLERTAARGRPTNIVGNATASNATGSKGGITMASERDVREFYDDALHCYQRFMGDRWHHGDPQAEAEGVSPRRACEVLEERIVALLGIGKQHRVLDFGSGIGGPTLHMAEVTGASFVGVTNNDRLNQIAREEAESRGLSQRVKFVTLGDTDYQHFPFADDSFDAVTFYESVCHIPDKAALFRDIARVLKPGGRLGGMDWIQRPFGDVQSEEQIMELMRPLNELTAIPGHGTVTSYATMMTEAGLEVSSARDLYEGVKSRGSATSEEQAEWLAYQGPAGARFAEGKRALDRARGEGVFSVGMFIAAKPRGTRREG